MGDIVAANIMAAKPRPRRFLDAMMDGLCGLSYVIRDGVCRVDDEQSKTGTRAACCLPKKQFPERGIVCCTLFGRRHPFPRVFSLCSRPSALTFYHLLISLSAIPVHIPPRSTSTETRSLFSQLTKRQSVKPFTSSH